MLVSIILILLTNTTHELALGGVVDFHNSMYFCEKLLNGNKYKPQIMKQLYTLIYKQATEYISMY